MLYAYTSEKKWIPLKFEGKYVKTYKFVKGMLDICQGKGNTINKTQYSQTHICNNITTDIITIESHRLCTVAYCVQYDAFTNGLRYLVYGTRYNQDSDYGIGIDLMSLTYDDIMKHCPNNVTAKFISSQ